jgi:chromosome partitioning protein
MIIVVGGIKGGSGKTTVATNLAVMNAKAHDVLLIDADDQETATDFTILRNATLSEGAGYTSIKLTGPAVRTETQRLAAKYDTIIIDTGGRDTTSQRAALSIATLLLVPFIPRSFDIWTLDKVSTLVEEMRAANPSLAAYVFINRADPRGQDNADTADALRECQGLRFVHTPLGSRKAYSNAAAQGLGVLELKPQDPKATEEMLTLYQSVFNVTPTLKTVGEERA